MDSRSVWATQTESKHTDLNPVHLNLKKQSSALLACSKEGMRKMLTVIS